MYGQTPPDDREIVRDYARDPSALDRDPARWRPQFYVVDVELDAAVGSINTGTVSLNNQPFVLQRVTHAIKAADFLADANSLNQDGQYLIEWKDDSTNYQSAPALADALFGSVRTGNFLDLPSPIVYPESKTLTARITNLVDRTAGGARAKFSVQVIFHGVQQWGQ